MRNIWFGILVVFLLASFGCERDNFSSSPSLKLSFSADTVMFDTVFTKIGSSTRHVKVYNRSKHDVNISSIELAGGSSSYYRLNIDGVAAPSLSNVPLRNGDSLYVFVEVTVDPTNQNAPLLIADSIVFRTNGNVQDVNLIAWGQDVHLFAADTLKQNTIFTADKPYLIYDYLWVPNGIELQVEEGAALYFHNTAQLVVSGSLKVHGAAGNPVIFQGDRLEDYYQNKAGQWGGIHLAAGSVDNRIDWAEIRNAIIGLMVDTVYNSNPTLVMSSTKIENMSYIGLWGRGARIEVSNSLIGNAAQVSLALTLGGNYKFYQTTIANYWSQFKYRNGPAVLLNNYYQYKLNPDADQWLVDPRDLTEATFKNCIIYGTRNEELTLDYKFNGSPVDALMEYSFENCIVKVPDSFLSAPKFQNVTNKDPKFISPSELNFRLDTLSPAKDFGLIGVGLAYPFDLDNNSRTADTAPDLGAYERIEKPASGSRK